VHLEGRSWLPDNFTHGALWIHAAAAEPDPEDVELVEAQYKVCCCVRGPKGRPFEPFENRVQGI
jgi:hypothetical protein